jgi:hypothetical protein
MPSYKYTALKGLGNDIFRGRICTSRDTHSISYLSHLLQHELVLRALDELAGPL